MFTPINGWTKSKIVKHIKKNFKGKSIGPATEFCEYRGPDGKKCAVGLFIPDNKYMKSMDDGFSASDLLIEYPGVAELMPLSGEALNRLQGIHDGSKPDKTLIDMLAWIEKHVSN